jgi:hypothetical protein
MRWLLVMANLRSRYIRQRTQPVRKCLADMAETGELRLVIQENLVHLLQRLLLVEQLYFDVDQSLLIHSASSWSVRWSL